MPVPFRWLTTRRANSTLPRMTMGVAAMMLLAACDGATGPKSAAPLVTLSFATNPASGGAAAFASVDTTPTTSNLVITSAQVVFSRLELTSSSDTACADDDHDGHDHCQEVRRSFVVVDLPVDTSVQTVVNTAIPSGSYSALEARLRIPDSVVDSASAAFLAAHPEFTGANVRVQGTYNGTPFTYTGAVNAKLELEFSPPAVVDSAGLNITVRVDLSTWFSDGHGGTIDPTTALTGGANAELVRDNIRQSFHAFEDHEHGGRDGHGDGHRGEDGGQGGDTQRDTSGGGH